MSTGFEIRELRTQAEYAACVDLQQEIWGPDFNETVPAAILQVVQKVGGIAGGVFDGTALIGFVFGITGIESGEPVHWSDMLAVRSDYRDRGIGEKLKAYQRSVLLGRGVKRMHWTFDPLDAKNAWINFHKLRVFAGSYVPDMYGYTNSPLHANGTDRLIVTWQLDRDRAATPVDERIEIPFGIHDMSRDDARAWRLRTRAQFQQLLPDYIVTDFTKEKSSGYYALTSASNFAT